MKRQLQKEKDKNLHKDVLINKKREDKQVQTNKEDTEIVVTTIQD
jgi:hypothetical protein